MIIGTISTKAVRRFDDIKSLDVPENDIESIWDDPLINEDARLLVAGLLKSHGVRRPIISNCAVYQFFSVDMHVDFMSSRKCDTIVIMLKGDGNLIFCESVNPTSIKQHSIRRRDIVTFNPNFPHQFKTKKRCTAIIADVLRTQVSQLR